MLDGKQCVAKFARHPYPHELHKCWGARGLMPELRMAPSGQEVIYVPGGWSLVYMDYLSPRDGWQTLRKVRVGEQLPACNCNKPPDARGVVLVFLTLETHLSLHALACASYLQQTLARLCAAAHISLSSCIDNDSCIDCRPPKQPQTLQSLQRLRLWLRVCWPTCISHAPWTAVRRCVCMGTSTIPTLWPGTELGLALHACAASLIWHVLALSIQASVLHSRCGAPAQSLHLLLSRSLVYCLTLQSQVDALGPPAL